MEFKMCLIGNELYGNDGNKTDAEKDDNLSSNRKKEYRTLPTFHKIREKGKKRLLEYKIPSYSNF